MAPGAESRSVALDWPRRPGFARLSWSQRAALRDVSRAFLLSRAVVWAAGIAVVLAVGADAEASPRLDPLWLTAPFDGQLANLMVAPAARFDSSWYLEIASFGYEVDARAAFFPLYPALVSLLGTLTGSSLLAGIAISFACSLAGLYLLHRLIALDHGAQAAQATIWIVACFPAALCLSAVYTEGLFLLLSAGSIYAGRLGRWRTAALVAGLAAATRSAGVLLVVPLAMLYLYGPRADREPERPGEGWRPRYALRGDAAWLIAVPAGLVAYLAYLAHVTGDPTAALAAQSDWARVFAPLGAIAMGIWSGVGGLVELLPGLGSPGEPEAAGGLVWHGALLNAVLLGFLGLAAWLAVETSRRLPPAYLAYALISLALPLSVPAVDTPLMSLPRFMLVAFPLWIALALWALERGAVRRVLAVSMPLLVVATALFTSWSIAP